MVPTTVNGIILLLVVLFPGFFYVLRREPHTPSRKFSAFRETMRVIVASASAYFVSGTLVLVGSWFVGLWTPSAWVEVLGALQSPYRYQDAHPLRFLAGGVALVILATSLCVLCGGLLPGRTLKWLANHGTVASKKLFTHIRASRMQMGSAWWSMLESGPDRTTVVSITLHDGNTVVGDLYSYNMDADDTADRDIVLQGKVFLLKPNKEPELLPDPIAIVSAREIKYMTLQYTVAPGEPEQGTDLVSSGDESRPGEGPVVSHPITEADRT
ncbi:MULTISPECIES: DUF6338 family protein [Clavibacter]|uniref:DUF6338 family protein n=1 Tax=Clavibacter seminis TaxID=2860285 RepID=A0ABY3TEY0_9MICO|nr:MULTISPECIES: DUF6338 family protein [Clavibacter]UKF26720.1 DUF6338 family protein [Clavibacter sp. A6099]